MDFNEVNITETTEDDQRSDGLVGLENLGNTCYMNAALQVLSNCSQMTELLIDHPTVIGQEYPPNLSKAYQNLLLDMWYSKRPQTNSIESLYHTFRHRVAIPRTVLSVFRQSHNNFCGFGQHDSQEFMRTFLNDIHEELKIVSFSDLNAITTKKLNRQSPSTNGEIPASDVSVTCSIKGKADKVLHESGDTKTKKKSPITSISSKTPTTKNPSSIVTDVFQGSLLTSIQCLSCGKVSTRPEVFLDLSLPLTEPRVPKQQDAITQTRLCPSPSKSRSRNNSFSIRLTRRLPTYITNPASRIISVSQRVTKPPLDFSIFIASTAAIYLWILVIWLQSFVWSPKISLQNCLDSFFDEDELNGENKYSCKSCSKPCNGMMHFQLLKLPEVLCLHLKRFRHDFINASKISSCVDFPLRDLDLSPYLHPSCPDKVKRYNLFGVVCHSGSVRAGHYYSYALNQREQSWYEYDDSHVSPVSDSTIASSLNSSAYILLYKKQEEMITQARDDRHYLESTIQITPSTPMVYISRRWHMHFKLFADPGPVENSDFLCSHGALQPMLWNYRVEYVDCISMDLWNFYINKFGGGPPVTELNPCAICTKTLQALEQRRFTEKEFFLGKCNSQPAVFVLSQKWFTTWIQFVADRRLEPPKQIDNTDVLEPIFTQANVQPSSSPVCSTYRLRRSASYKLVSEACWRYFHSIYDGGPEYMLNVSNSNNQLTTLLSKAHAVEAQPPLLLKRKEASASNKNGWDDEVMNVDDDEEERSFCLESPMATSLSSTSKTSLPEMHLSENADPVIVNGKRSVLMWESNGIAIAANSSNTPSPCNLTKPDQNPCCNGDNETEVHLQVNGEANEFERGNGDFRRLSILDEQHQLNGTIDKKKKLESVQSTPGLHKDQWQRRCGQLS